MRRTKTVNIPVEQQVSTLDKYAQEIESWFILFEFLFHLILSRFNSTEK